MNVAEGAPFPGDVAPEEFRRLAHEVADWIADFLSDVDELPVFPAALRPGEIRGSLPPSAPEVGEPLDRSLADFKEVILPGITHWNHPSFHAYFSVTGSAPGILGEMLSAALNINAMVWRSSPAATELEELTMDWLRQLVGLPDAFDGVINDTGSTSTFHALAAARERAYPGSRESGLWGRNPGRIYGSEHAHSSVEKAGLALGFGQAGYRAIASDECFRLRPEALRTALEEDIAAGIVPVAVVPTLGTTSTTSLDPVGDIIRVVRTVERDAGLEHPIWVHVDACYGGPAAIVPELRRLFDGWEEADSIVINPHKWLFTPIDCSALYCRHPDVIVRAFSLVPAYLETPERGEARNLMDYGIALGRRFRALKLWFVLRTFGLAGIEARIRAHVDMARSFAAWVEEAASWELAAPVPLALVVFRYVPAGCSEDEVDVLNERIIEHVNATGEAFVGPTRLHGRVVIRLAIGNLKTTPAHVARVWALLREAAREVGQGGR